MKPKRHSCDGAIRNLQDRNWMFNQSGVIPFRHSDGELLLLLITSRRKKHWIVPKGIVEFDKSAADSAAQEAFEEAGVSGLVYTDSVGEYSYRKWGGTCRVRIFLMEVQDERKEWPEDFFRERQWLRLEEAVERVDQEDLKRIIRKVPEFLNQIRESCSHEERRKKS